MDTNFYVAVNDSTGAKEFSYETFALAEKAAYAASARTDVFVVHVYNGNSKLVMSYSKETLTWTRHKENYEIVLEDFNPTHVEFDLKERTLEYFFGKGVLSRIVNNDPRIKAVNSLASTASTLREPFQSSPNYTQPTLGANIGATGSVKNGGYVYGSASGKGGSTYTAPAKSIIPEQDAIMKKLVNAGEIERDNNPNRTITSLAREFAVAFPLYAEGVNALYAALHYLREVAVDKKTIVEILNAQCIQLTSSNEKVSFIRYIERNPGKYVTINTFINSFIDSFNKNVINIEEDSIS